MFGHPVNGAAVAPKILPFLLPYPPLETKCSVWSQYQSLGYLLEHEDSYIIEIKMTHASIQVVIYGMTSCLVKRRLHSTAS